MLEQLWSRLLPWGLSFILATFTLGFSHPAYAISARDSFRTAYENRYTWDEQFPGYTADLSVNYNGELYQGMVRIKPDLSVEVIDIENPDIRMLLENQLKMEVIHRRRVPFDKMHGNNSFLLVGTDDAGASIIKEVGDEMDSYYQVKDGAIAQVNRRFDDIAVTVDTLGTNETPAGYLVSHFQTTFRDALTGKILEQEDVRDIHEKIGNYYVLTNRTIQTF
ncbi:MAG: DUF3386 family protein [Hormoscilla sp.]